MDILNDMLLYIKKIELQTLVPKSKLSDFAFSCYEPIIVQNGHFEPSSLESGSPLYTLRVPEVGKLNCSRLI